MEDKAYFIEQPENETHFIFFFQTSDYIFLGLA